MRILFVAPRFHTNQYQAVKTLIEKEHQVSFHVASLGFTEDHSLVQPVRYPQAKASLLLERLVGQGGVNHPNYFPNPIGYWKAFRQLRPEIAIIRDPFKLFSVLAAICALFTRTKIVFYTQEHLRRKLTAKTKLKRKMALRFFGAAWMTPIVDAAQSANARMRHMYYVPLPVPVQPEDGMHNANSGFPRILMVGKYHQKRKNHLLLIQAAKILSQQYQFQLTIVGECMRETQMKKYAELEDVVCRLGLQGMVKLERNVPYAQMKDLYLSHDIFVLPARDEQYGVSVTEALGYGLPAICTDTCGARFNIRNGENGFVVRSDSVADLVTALEHFLANRHTLAEMQLRSIQYVQQHLSGDAFYQKFSQLVQQRFGLTSMQFKTVP